MTSFVRRMVFDFRPAWLAAIAVLVAILPLLDGLWLAQPRSLIPQVFVFFLAMPALTAATIKLPVWGMLPVSRREIGRAQWWLAVASPLLIVLASLSAALAVVGLCGGVAASPAQIAALAGDECALAVAFPALALWNSIARNRLAAVVAVGWLALLAVVAFSPLTLAVGLTAGALAATAAVVTYLAPTMVLLRSTVQLSIGARRAGARSRPTLRSGMRGWATLAAPFLTDTAGMAVVSIFAFATMRLLARHGNALTDPTAAGFAMAVLALAPSIFGAQVRQSARALRGLPVSGDFLASASIGAVVAAQLLAFSALYLACRLLTGPADALLRLLPFAIGFSACSLPLYLRSRNPIGAALSFPVFIIGNDILAGSPTLAWLGVAVGFAGVVAGWVWLRFELTRGRRAYRPWPTATSSWRGRQLPG
ncbi:MAG TPA: hypothetical protein VGL58_19430 [Caulobacteraceae bacterium]